MGDIAGPWILQPKKNQKDKKEQAPGLPFLTAEDILNVGGSCKKEESPINLTFEIMREIRLSPMEWENFSVPPKLMKMSNSGSTAILSAKWHGPRPYLSNGPVSGKYVFTQLHFHWGRTFHEGSEHRVNGESLPLEAHAMFFKNVYISQTDAMKRNDGIVTMAYFFNLQEEDNDNLMPITEVLSDIAVPLTSQYIARIPLKQFIPYFSDDYFLYWGNVINMSVLWLICRKPLGISLKQLTKFQKLLGSDKKPIEKNFRKLQDLNHRVVFHVNPSENKIHPLLPIRDEEKSKKSNLIQKVYSFAGPNVPNQQLYIVAEQEERKKSNIHNENIDYTPGNKGNPLSIGDSEEKKDSMTDLLNFSLKRKPNVKELKYTLARILLELEKKENNDDLGVLENYIKAKYAATHERIRLERNTFKANELPTKQQSKTTNNSIKRIDSADLLKKPGDSSFNNALNVEEGTLYENSVKDLNETSSAVSRIVGNNPQLKNKQSSMSKDFPRASDTFEEQKSDRASVGRAPLVDDERLVSIERRGKSASEEQVLSKKSSKCLEKFAFDSPDVFRSHRARLMMEKSQSAHRIRETSRELVTYTTSCEVQETLTILETTKSDNYSLMTSEVVSSDSDCEKTFSAKISSSDEATWQKSGTRGKKNLTDIEIKELKEKIKIRRLKSKVTLAQSEGEVKTPQNSTPPGEKMPVEKKGHQALETSQSKNDDECQRRRALIRKSMKRLMKDRETKENLHKPKTPEKPTWRP